MQKDPPAWCEWRREEESFEIFWRFSINFCCLVFYVNLYYIMQTHYILCFFFYIFIYYFISMWGLKKTFTKIYNTLFFFSTCTCQCIKLKLNFHTRPSKTARLKLKVTSPVFNTLFLICRSAVFSFGLLAFWSLSWGGQGLSLQREDVCIPPASSSPVLLSPSLWLTVWWG